jgi:hypothetical protein
MGVIILLVLAVVVGCFFISLTLRRHGEVEKPNANWRQTDELFNDPSTNRVMRVWLDTAGDRHYVPEGTRRST